MIYLFIHQVWLKTYQVSGTVLDARHTSMKKTKFIYWWSLLSGRGNIIDQETKNTYIIMSGWSECYPEGRARESIAKGRSQDRCSEQMRLEERSGLGWRASRAGKNIPSGWARLFYFRSIQEVDVAGAKWRLGEEDTDRTGASEVAAASSHRAF